MKSPAPFILFTLLFSVVLSGQSAMGAVIITPTGALSATGNLSSRPIGETINGNGLSSGGGSGDILSETHNVNSGNSGQYWIGNYAGAELTFTLSGPSTVGAVHLWNYSRTGEIDRAISSFRISFSTDGLDFNTLPKFTINNVLIETYPDPIDVQSFGFTAQSGVTHVRLDQIVNHGDGSLVGLSEIRFADAIPEPCALLLSGLGGLLLLRRRR